jgi:hypothetical protein
LTRALETLPSGYRTIFELHEIGGYGHREIAKLLRCSVGNSKSQLHKAKQKIREALVSRSHFGRSVRSHSKASTARSEPTLTRGVSNADLTLNLLVGRSQESLAGSNA